MTDQRDFDAAIERAAAAMITGERAYMRDAVNEAFRFIDASAGRNLTIRAVFSQIANRAMAMLRDGIAGKNIQEVDEANR